MLGDGAAVDFRAGSWLANALCDIEDDAGEAVLVDPDFLVIGNFSEFAATCVSDGCWEDKNGFELT